jgi:hypothetical protein
MWRQRDILFFEGLRAASFKPQAEVVNAKATGNQLTGEVCYKDGKQSARQP